MTESKGPGTPGGKAAATNKRKGLLQQLRPYAIGIVAMVVVFGGSALIGAHVRSTKDTKVTEPNGAVAAAKPVPSTSASPTATPTSGGPKLDLPVNPTVPVTVTVFEDLRSPDSKAFQEEYAATFQQLLDTGQVRFQYRLVIPTDAQYGGKGSLVAANAAACAQDQGRFSQFVAQVWENQPADPKDDAFDSTKLMERLARKAHKIDAATFEPCVKLADHEGWVLASQDAFTAAGLGGKVPVVQIDGTTVKDMSTLTPKKLRAQIQNEVKRSVALKATPTDTPALSG
jgi:protein-disulfide isomerase